MIVQFLSTYLSMKNRFRDHYADLNYLSKTRWSSYYAQLEETMRTNPKTVLEIGKGFGLLVFVLEGLGVKVTTLDIDQRLNPKVVGDVRKLPFRNNSFDCVVCFEVLEHLPFKDFSKGIGEMRRVTKKHVIISLPEPYSTTLYFGLKLFPFIPKLEFFRKLSFGKIFFPKFSPTGPHKWELGRENATYKKVTRVIKKNNLAVVKSFCSCNNAYHRFLILEKI